jgi:hypothetical protein
MLLHNKYRIVPMNVMSRAVKAFLDEINKPETYVEGDEFENFVRNKLFPAGKYDLVQKSPDYITNKYDFADTPEEPDFKFRPHEGGREFFVEATFRSGFHDDAVDCCNFHQLKHYHEIDKSTPVYIVIGVGLPAAAPQHLYLIPAKDIKNTTLNNSFLKDYIIPAAHNVNHKDLR